LQGIRQQIGACGNLPAEDFLIGIVFELADPSAANVVLNERSRIELPRTNLAITARCDQELWGAFPRQSKQMP